MRAQRDTENRTNETLVEKGSNNFHCYIPNNNNKWQRHRQVLCVAVHHWKKWNALFYWELRFSILICTLFDLIIKEIDPPSKKKRLLYWASREAHFPRDRWNGIQNLDWYFLLHFQVVCSRVHRRVKKIPRCSTFVFLHEVNLKKSCII